MGYEIQNEIVTQRNKLHAKVISLSILLTSMFRRLDSTSNIKSMTDMHQ